MMWTLWVLSALKFMERGGNVKAVNVVILSGSCCYPQLAKLDDKVQARIKEIADRKQLQLNIKVITISSAAFSGLGLGKEIGDTVRRLMSSKGMSVLPVVIFNTEIAFYGGLASIGLIEEKLDVAVQS